jgi:hypothetical protein
MLVECGFATATTSEGVEYSFTPSLGRIAALGSPQEIVRLYAGLHGPSAAKDAAYILATLCDQEDPTPLIGGLHIGKEAPPVRTHAWWAFWARFLSEPQTPDRFEDEVLKPVMPEDEQIAIARHLMHHGIVGKSKPDQKSSGGYSDSFKASEYIAAACVHLGLTRADAERLSMTEFQTMFEMKFPSKADGKRDVPTREEYQASMAAIEGRRNV